MTNGGYDLPDVSDVFFTFSCRRGSQDGVSNEASPGKGVSRGGVVDNCSDPPKHLTHGQGLQRSPPGKKSFTRRRSRELQRSP